MGTKVGEWITEADIAAGELELLLRLWRKTWDLSAQSPSIDAFRNPDRGLVWYSGCSCDRCTALVEQLDVAQAELQVGFKTVAMRIGAESSDWSPAWRRVAGFFNAYVAEEEKARREMWQGVGDGLHA